MANDDKPGKKPDAGPGGVEHDARGNAVWHWAVESGKQALDSTSRLLKRLEVPGLKLEGDDTPAANPHPDPKPHSPAAGKSTLATKPDPKVGYDPYGGAANAGARPEAARKPAATPPARPSLLGRLFRKN
jgi:hypothetical protein